MKKKPALWILVLVGAISLWWTHGRLKERSDHPAAPRVNTLDVVDQKLVVPNELVVDFRDDESRSRIAELENTFSVSFRPAAAHINTGEIYTVESAHPEQLLAQLRALSDVEAADFDLLYGLPEGPESTVALPQERAPADPEQRGFPNDPKFKYQWHLTQIHTPAAWKGAQGDGVVVALIDTGVAKVPDLDERTLLPGWNFVNDNANAADDHGHGTHVAGTIAQATHNGIGVAGVAFHAKIMPIKVLSARGSGSVSGIAAGIRYAADHGAKVINMSLGGPIASSVLAKAVKYAHDKGVVVICAAGNDGRGKVSYPAAYPFALAVAATQFDEKTTFYSNWGKEIDIAAPGGNTRIDQNGDGMVDGVLQNTVVPGDISRNDYLPFMGTSMASPHVAGVAALIISSGVTDPDAVERVIKETARPSAASDPSENRYGAGIIDAAAAVKKAQLNYGGAELLVGLSTAALMLSRLRRTRRLGTLLGAPGWFGLAMGASGLFFLPWLAATFLPIAMATHPVVRFLSHGIPQWDMAILGAQGHGHPIFYSALIPMVATLFLYSKRSLRGLCAGLTIGVGAHLICHAFLRTADVQYVPNLLFGSLDTLWLLFNGLLSLAFAHLVLRQ